MKYRRVEGYIIQYRKSENLAVALDEYGIENHTKVGGTDIFPPPSAINYKIATAFNAPSMMAGASGETFYIGETLRPRQLQ